MRQRSDAREHHEAGCEVLKDFDPGMLLPGITVNTSASNFAPIRQLQLIRFKGETWQRFGPIMGGEASGA